MDSTKAREYKQTLIPILYVNKKNSSCARGLLQNVSLKKKKKQTNKQTNICELYLYFKKKYKQLIDNLPIKKIKLDNLIPVILATRFIGLDFLEHLLRILSFIQQIFILNFLAVVATIRFVFFFFVFFLVDCNYLRYIITALASNDG